MGVTMLTLARFTLKGPYQAASVIAMLAVLAVFVPLILPWPEFGLFLATVFTMVSCVLVGLIILTQGTLSGLRVIAVSVVGITLIGWAVVARPELGFWTAMVQWLPVVVLAQTLRSSRSLSLTIMIAVGVAILAIAMQYGFWGNLETELVDQALLNMRGSENLQPEFVEQNVRLVRLFVVALISMAFLIMMLVVLTARWLQAGIAGSDGFGQEFRSLVLGKQAALVALAVVLLSIWLGQTWLNSIAILVTIAFMFQGIAIVHSRLAKKKQAGFLFGLFYVLLLIVPQVVAITAIIGIIDNWLVFRKNAENHNNLS
ncbi:MAG: hypothetical protein ACI9LO_002946 [Planctomycetota bacterium]|jgi:hypothetical protein